MVFKIVGNSGCLIELLQDTAGLPFIRKSTQDIKYSSRLMEQAKKQESFLMRPISKIINAPKVSSYQTCTFGSYIDMEFIVAFDYIDFLLSANIAAVEDVSNKLCEFIDYTISDSSPAPFDRGIFLNKYHQVAQRVLKNDLSNNFEVIKLLEQLEVFFYNFHGRVPIPIGFCHGDLTFSNILFSQTTGQITFIDFLDSFIDSPIIDIVKLRQDTFFFWSFMMYTRSFNHTRIEAIMRTLDRAIDTHCNQYPFYKEYYNVFQIMNIFRILPYANNSKIVGFVVKNIYSLMEG